MKLPDEKKKRKNLKKATERSQARFRHIRDLTKTTTVIHYLYFNEKLKKIQVNTPRKNSK